MSNHDSMIFKIFFLLLLVVKDVGRSRCVLIMTIMYVKKPKIFEKPRDLILLEQTFSTRRKDLILQASGQTTYVLKKARPV